MNTIGIIGGADGPTSIFVASKGYVDPKEFFIAVIDVIQSIILIAVIILSFLSLVSLIKGTKYR